MILPIQLDEDGKTAATIELDGEDCREIILGGALGEKKEQKKVLAVVFYL